MTFPARRQSYDSSSRQSKGGGAKQQLGALCSCYRSAAPIAYLCLTKSESALSVTDRQVRLIDTLVQHLLVWC